MPATKELAWLDKITTSNLKNYQIWHHRQVVMSGLFELPKGEMVFLARMLAKDAKNYHVWSYRQWLVRHFGLWPDTSAGALEGAQGAGGEDAVAAGRRRGGEGELRFIDALLINDVRNNSAWNHRFFLLFGREAPTSPAPWVFEREIDYAQQKIELAPQNLAAWNYLRGIAREQKPPTSDVARLEDFAKQFAQVDGPVENIRSSHALDLLAEIWGANGNVAGAHQALELLSERFEPIKKGYWEYRMRQLPTQPVAAS